MLSDALLAHPGASNLPLNMSKLSLTTRKNIKDNEPKLQANLKKLTVRNSPSSCGRQFAHT